MFPRRSVVWVVAVSAGLAAVGVAQAEKPYEIAWVRQLGTSASEGSSSVSADGLGNVYISGGHAAPWAGRTPARVTRS